MGKLNLDEFKDRFDNLLGTARGLADELEFRDFDFVDVRELN